jgi:hypothetical protein
MVASAQFNTSMSMKSDLAEPISAPAAPRAARSKVAGRLFALSLLGATALLPISAHAAERDAVRVWNEHAIVALTNGNGVEIPGIQFSPPVAIIHLAIVQGAVYDAVNAIKGGYQPYLQRLTFAPSSASKGAAAATAAHHVLVALVDQAPLTATLTLDVKGVIKARLDASYKSSLAEIPNGQAKAHGIRIGEDAAAAMLANRVADGRFGAPGFPVPAVPGPGQWRPLNDTPAANDPNGWVRTVRPFTLPSPETFHTSGPSELTSPQYTAEFNEVKTLGRATESTRTDQQTALANWSGGHPVPLMFRGMQQVSVAKGLTISQDARFFAMTSMATADSIINCWAEKAHWGFWRPTTAIRLAATDNNPDTAPDAAWTSLLGVPPYADEPSGANCFTGGLMAAAKAFFGSDVATFSLTSPGNPLVPGSGSTRHYTRFSDVTRDMTDARVFGGLHFRRADVNGALLGQQVADHVDKNFFNCKAPGQCKQEERE